MKTFLTKLLSFCVNFTSNSYMTCPTKCNIPKDVITINENKIIVIGDLHADYSKTVSLLKYFKLIDQNLKWIGNKTIIVQLGDQVDGAGRAGLSDAVGEIDILNLFDNLHEQAIKQGGGVYSLLGNHELMNTLGYFDYASKEDMAINGGNSKRIDLFTPSNESNKGCLAKKFACTRNVFLKINDILFVHAGIVPELVRDKGSSTISYVNQLMRDYLNGDKDKNNSEILKYFSNSNSVLFDRTLGRENVNCEQVSDMLKQLNANYIIVGHTPQSIINSKCNNKIWRVDVGLSRSLGDNTSQVLEISINKNKTYNFKILN